MNIEEVKRISKVSKQEKWPYPRTFQELQDAGVASYRTCIADNQTVFMGEAGSSSYEEPNDKSAASSLEVAEQFQSDAVRRGLAHHKQHRTPFTDFIKDMADAGVHYYEVNMKERTINYTSGRPGESYVEAIPPFE
ncbi:uncharacterized protein YbcV (DUF1398 family) [Paenibacillus taihuensis]|uniref:Uncharacterized protein YbcV (DUF1398 family) n=1 Tax=Paenibacillus taihuensis TaxID=1156355 RepID=A0A3D9RQH3_9BACL|nr:DUF1398 family protein [Paenibacillus taihuensis]REE78695.1 uncharacterized protein YbcV (DUF1398 family) [Paenibacillus taihuensis]